MTEKRNASRKITDRRKAKLNMKRQWAKFIVVALL